MNQQKPLPSQLDDHSLDALLREPLSHPSGKLDHRLEVWIDQLPPALPRRVPSSKLIAFYLAPLAATIIVLLVAFIALPLSPNWRAAQSSSLTQPVLEEEIFALLDLVRGLDPSAFEEHDDVASLAASSS
ncbi:MAG: hypothetical protein ACFCU4_08145 [Puniceicoccaceae bacterium]